MRRVHARYTAAAADRPIVLISAGIGLTPLLAMFKDLAYQQFASPVYFIHAARNSRFHALADEVRAISDERANFYSHVLYDAPLPSDVRSQRCDTVGRVDVSFLRKVLRSKNAEFYFCGPQPFMTALLQGLKGWGVPNSRIHFEFFGPKQDIAGARVLPPEPSHFVLQTT